MTCRDVKDVIHEALIVYIDEISAIKSVRSFSEGKMPSHNEELEVILKNGDKYRLLIIRSSD